MLAFFDPCPLPVRKAYLLPHIREKGPGPRAQEPARGLTPLDFPQAGSEALLFSALALRTHMLGEHRELLVAPVCSAGLGRPHGPCHRRLGTCQLPRFPEGGAPQAGARQRVGRPAPGAVPCCFGHPSSRGDGVSVLNPPLESSACLSPACLGPLGAPCSARPAFPELKGAEAWVCRRVSGLESTLRLHPHQPPL